jgi:MFS family permease
MAGLKGNFNLISSGILSAVFIISTVFTLFFIDFTGRRPLLICGAIGMGVCHFVVGGILGAYSVPAPGGVAGNTNVGIALPENSASSHKAIAFSYLLIIVYALTLAPVAWVYASEVWSLETRAYGMVIAYTIN